MERRALLTAVGTITAGVAGCLESTTVNTDTTSDANSNANSDEDGWAYNIEAGNLTVSDGRVFAEEVTGGYKNEQKHNGGIFALDVKTGEFQWSYGSSHDLSHLSYTTAESGIYTEYSTDEANAPNSIAALGLDSHVRWKNVDGWFSDAIAETVFISVPGPSYRESSNDLNLRALDVTTGEELWTSEQGGSVEFDKTASTFPETIYVNRGKLAAIDTNDGSVKWIYGTEENSFRDHTVSNGVVYSEKNWNEAVVAVSEGEEIWSVESLSPSIEAIISDHVLISDLSPESQNPIYAFDAETGEEQWVVEDIGSGEYRTFVSLYEDIMYVGAGSQISAFTVTDGTELWSKSIGDGGSIETLDVVTENEGSNHMLYIVVDDLSLHKVHPDGTVSSSWTVDEPINDFVVDESIIVATESSIYTLDSQ